jgi:N utilization substance protein B
MTEVRGYRRRSREAALAYLFQMDADVDPITKDIRKFLKHFEVQDNCWEYCERLVNGVLSDRELIDQEIERTAENWKLYRMESVDRSILRLATWELFHCLETDYQVIIDEAVELAKSFGSDNSAAFVNGILDQLARKIRVPEEAIRTISG